MTTDPVEEFVAALRDTDAVFEDARSRILAAGVADTAFGRLFEARAVHDAYRQRVPDMARDIEEARVVLADLIRGVEAVRRGRTRRAPAPRTPLNEGGDR